jgi:uncharacterized protein with beta-barrel porin domain
MEEISKNNDTQEAHYDALMCQVLTEQGYAQGVEIFTDMPKWYV